MRSQRSQRKSHEDLLACVREMRRLHNDRDGIEGEYSGMKNFKDCEERDAQNYYARV